MRLVIAELRGFWWLHIPSMFAQYMDDGDNEGNDNDLQFGLYRIAGCRADIVAKAFGSWLKEGGVEFRRKG